MLAYQLIQPLFMWLHFTGSSTWGQMGLGKTLQAISLLSHLKLQRIAPGPFCAYTPPWFPFSLIPLLKTSPRLLQLLAFLLIQ
jgi:hypothetical protein